MTDVDDRPATNGRKLATNLRELLNRVDIKADYDRTRVDEAEVSTLIESEAERSQSPQSSLRDVFAKARTGIPRRGTPSSRLPRPRTSSVGSDISASTVFTPRRVDDESTTGMASEHTPVARPTQPSAAASFNALRARLESASDTHTDTTADLTGWDRSARSLLTTRGQASSSKLNMYLDNEDTNLLDEDLGGMPALTVSHVDDSNMRFAPSVGNSSRTPLAPRSRPNPVPKGPSLQSASIAERLAGIPDDALEFDDTDREDFDRNRMDDDSEDLLNKENDLLRSSSPPPDSPRRPQPYRSLLDKTQRASRPISGSWENLMGESLLSLPNPPESPQRPHAGTSRPLLAVDHSTSGSSSGDASRLMQTIQSEEDSFQRTLQENSRQTENSQQDTSNATRSDSTTPARTSRLSMFGRSRLPLAKPSPKPPTEPPTTSAKSAASEITFPRSSTPTSPEKRAPVAATPQSPRPRAVSAQPSPGSPPRSTNRAAVPVTPSRIPRVSMHGSHPSWDKIDVANSSPQPLTRSQSSLGHNQRLTPARSTSSLSHRGTPPETDVDRERNWNKPLPKLTHANLRMRHDSMESSVGSSIYGGLSPSRPGSVAGGRPTTPSGRSFIGYSVREGSEVSSSQGSAGSDEDTEARRARKMSSPSISRSGAELRGPRSSLTSPTASSLARSAGLTRHSSLKSPARVGAPVMRHSASFAGSSVSGLSDRASPIGSPARKLMPKKSVEYDKYDKEVEHLRERDWGRPVHSRAPGIGSISPRPPRVSGGARQRVVSGGSVDERPESPITRMRASSGAGLKPRPHTIHFGNSSEDMLATGTGRGPLVGGEELLEEAEQETEREDVEYSAQGRSHGVPASPPSPSRSIPLPPSPPAVHVSAPAEASVSLFRLESENDESPAESTRRGPGPVRQEPELAREPESPRRAMVPAQQESPTISFMDTLPPLPEPPSDDEIEEPTAAPAPVLRPQVNTRLSPHHLMAREPSPGSGGSGSEQTPRVSSLILPVPPTGQSRTPTPPSQPPVIRVEDESRGLDLLGVGQGAPAPRTFNARNRSNTLGSMPKVDVVNLNVPRDEVDSAATPIATKWMERNRVRAAEREQEAKQGSTSKDGRLTPKFENPPVLSPTADQTQPAPMVSQRGKEIIQRMQHASTSLARDLEVESLTSVPEPESIQTEQIVKLSAAARAERERLEKLRSARQNETEKIQETAVLNKRWSTPWMLLSMILTALCAWLALYAISQHASNVYLDPLYPVLYGGDANPLRPARTIDTFPSGWHVHMVPQDGIQHYLSANMISRNWQKLWALPNWSIQQLILNWPPS
ncbi:proteoglycan 4 [Ceratobasidium sp. AG-Ba]|nr:proteoglycan 4 [Ceratobasidium sp. AG-Ba]